MLKTFVALSASVEVMATLSPVVIVPGDGSNQLEARLNKPSTVSWRCSKTSDWYRLWLDASNLLLATDCWADNIKLIWGDDGEPRNNDGVETRVVDFGSTASFEELDPSVPLHGSAVFRDMVLKLMDQGYERNVTLRGAPYDFRYAPSSKVGAKFTDDLRQLVEDTFYASNARVSLISHSMGCLQTLYLLNSQPQEWKDKFVERWIPISGPFGGSTQEMGLYASGNNEGIPVSALSIREEQRSYETNTWLAPVPRIFNDTVLVVTPTRNYTAQDYDAFFDDIGFPTGKHMLNRVLPLTSAVTAPGVDVLCLYSYGVDTPTVFTYDDKGFDKQPKITMGDGDGTVNEVSLALCSTWKGAQTRSVNVKTYSGISHTGMLTDAGVLDTILTELGF